MAAGGAAREVCQALSGFPEEFRSKRSDRSRAQARRRWPWPGGTDVAVEELRALKDIMKRIV